jgi:NADH-quinone oxidoreductase subunit H
MIDFLWFAGKASVALGIIFSLGPMLIMGDRKISAWIQGRKGPNRVGPWGLLQPVADILKLVMKEVIIPADVDKVLFLLGPLIVFIPPVFGFCVIPFGNQIGDQKLQVVDMNIGLLFIMSVLSVGVYGITLGGWASNNKYSLLGSLRASAQLISYELTLGLTMLLVVMMTGTIDLSEIVLHQARNGWNVFGGNTWWGLPSGLIGFVLLFTCALAENNRLPFDMAECEAELVGGYHTEYSSMGFGMYMFSEYCAMILSSSLLVTLFLGGWSFPYLTNPDDHSVLAGIISFAVFMTKICIVLFLYIQIRWTLPRFRYDQIMNLGWKTFLPLSLVNIGVMAVIGVYLENP